jgi:putative transposase
MVRNHRLAKSIHDAAWSQLVALAEYKAFKAGSRVVRVPAAYSSQECFYCGTLNKVALDVRKFDCVGCGRALERDPNAARVVLKRGLAIAGLAAPMVGLDTPELRPAEMGPLLVSPTRGASFVREAGTTRAEICAGTPRL